MSAKSSSNFLLECFAECSMILCKYTKFPTRLQYFQKYYFICTPLNIICTPVNALRNKMLQRQCRCSLFFKKSFVNKLACSSIKPHANLFYVFNSYFTSSKSTIIHYQCVSTGCCVHVAKIKIGIDNQHVTKPMQRYDILSEQPKEKDKKHKSATFFFDLGRPYMEKREYIYPHCYIVLIFSCAIMIASLHKSLSCPSSTESIIFSANQRVSIYFSS